MRPGTAQELRRNDADVVADHPEGFRHVGRARQERLVSVPQREPEDVKETVCHEEIREEPVEPERRSQAEGPETEAVIDPITGVFCRAGAVYVLVDPGSDV